MRGKAESGPANLPLTRVVENPARPQLLAVQTVLGRDTLTVRLVRVARVVRRGNIVIAACLAPHTPFLRRSGTATPIRLPDVIFAPEHATQRRFPQQVCSLGHR